MAMAKTGTRYSADADMQAVLDAHAALGGKPIETLPVDEARRQSTVTDAVKAVLGQQGKSTAPTALVPGVTSADRTIPGPGGDLPPGLGGGGGGGAGGLGGLPGLPGGQQLPPGFQNFMKKK